MKALPLSTIASNLLKAEHSNHQGETREQRLNEYLEENDRPVVALREGAILKVTDTVISAQGGAGVRIYRRGRSPSEVPAGSLLDISTR